MPGGPSHRTDPACSDSSTSSRPSSGNESTTPCTGVRPRDSPTGQARKRQAHRELAPRAEEKCFALNAATIIDRAVELEAVGGTYANTRPTEFICLVLKLLQLQPEREIVLEYLRAEEFK